MSKIEKKVILCIDDERIILQSLRDQFVRNFGNDYIYEFAESGDEALEVIEEFDADHVQILVIVSDWLMPEMKGDELLIKIHQKFPKIVKIMLTGQADEKAITRAREEANLYCYISKPWEENSLITAIKTGMESQSSS